MIFAAPLGLLALVAIPAIVAIHLFRRRFPVRPIAGLFLWQIARRTPEGGGRVAKLPITASLLLECLAALALALILAGARCSPATVSHHLVVLVDDSASMGAVNAAGESPRDRALRRITAELERRSSTARATIVQSGERPAILAGPAVLAVEAQAALTAWNPQAPHHALAPGLRLARELAGETGTLMVVSDVPPDARGLANFEGGLWAAVGEPAANVGITGADRTRATDGNAGTVSLTLVSNASTPVRRQLRLSAGDREVAARDVDVPPGASSLTMTIPPGLPPVTVQLSDDSLRRDNDVVLAEPRPQTVAVENRLPEGRGRSALALALDSLSGVTSAVSGHLAFVDASEIEKVTAADVWRVGFGRPPAAWLAGGESNDYVGPFVVEKKHPLLQGVTFDGVVWSGAWPLAAERVRPLVSAGDRMLVGAPTASATAPSTTILVNLDLDRTNLIRSPDWPIFVSNVIEMRRQNLPGPERWNYRTGEWVRVRLDRDPTAPLSFKCGAVVRALPASRQLEFIAPSPGGLLQILEGDRVLFELGVNFLDEDETRLGDLATADTGELAAAPGLRAESGAASDPLFWVLLVIAGAALLINWCLLAPGRGARTAQIGLGR